MNGDDPNDRETPTHPAPATRRVRALAACAALLAGAALVGLALTGVFSGGASGPAPAVGTGALKPGAAATATRAWSTGAVVTAAVKPRARAWTYYFEYGTTTRYDHRTRTQRAGGRDAMRAASATLSGLAPGAHYHYRVVAANAAGVTYGRDETLTTESVTVHAVNLQRQVLWPTSTLAPTDPPFNVWTGAWVMPDGSVMTGFSSVTGSTGNEGRAPTGVLAALGETQQDPPPSGLAYLSPDRDFWGLTASTVLLRSPDQGSSWNVWRTDPVQAVDPRFEGAQADVALSDGTLLRRISGADEAYSTTAPHSAYLESLKFNASDSGGQASSWSAPIVLENSPNQCVSQISRLHQLPDGRVIAVGEMGAYPGGDTSKQCGAPYHDLLMVAANDSAAESGNWTLGMALIPPSTIESDEWDAAWLPNGDLLAYFRSENAAGTGIGYQAILQAQPPGSPYPWVLSNVEQMPYPVWPSGSGVLTGYPGGHPDLLATREGAVLSFTDLGVFYTGDGGGTWQRLQFQSPTVNYTTRYYPQAIEDADGNIYVFSQTSGPDGGDGPYPGPQSIEFDEFQLAVDSGAPPPSPSPSSLRTSPGYSSTAGTMTDRATVTGSRGTPTGAVTFNLYGPGDTACARSITAAMTVPLSNGTAASPPFTTSAPGTYQWVASYGGESGIYDATSGACSDASERVSLDGTAPVSGSPPSTSGSPAATSQSTAVAPPPTGATTSSGDQASASGANKDSATTQSPGNTRSAGARGRRGVAAVVTGPAVSEHRHGAYVALRTGLSVRCPDLGASCGAHVSLVTTGGGSHPRLQLANYLERVPAGADRPVVVQLATALVARLLGSTGATTLLVRVTAPIRGDKRQTWTRRVRLTLPPAG